jgi:hypothetical protein
MDEFKNEYMNQYNIPMSLNFLNKNTFNTSYKFNEIFDMPKQRQNRFQMEY